jgi:hypothetical protein
MGGMIGFKKNAFDLKLIDENYLNFDFTIKGEDQHFLENIIYPKVQQSITEHRIMGMPLRDNPYCYNYIQDINVDDVELDDLQKIENNHTIKYIGQCGWDTNKVFDFYEKYGNEKFNKELKRIIK